MPGLAFRFTLFSKRRRKMPKILVKRKKQRWLVVVDLAQIKSMSIGISCLKNLIQHKGNICIFLKNTFFPFWNVCHEKLWNSTWSTQWEQDRFVLIKLVVKIIRLTWWFGVSLRDFFFLWLKQCQMCFFSFFTKQKQCALMTD